MKKDIALSVIIPVYNGANYIGECLEAICQSQGSELEVIAVDDGSQDSSLAILQEYARMENRLQVIHQDNQGVSVARNTGLEHARGQWITFVDIDDLVEEHAIDAIIEAIRHADDVDLILGNYVEVSGENEILRQFPVADWVQEDVGKLQEQILCGYQMNACWGKVYRRDRIEEKGLRFEPSMKMGEDLIFVMAYCRQITKISSIHQVVYRYRQLATGAVLQNRSKLDDANIRDFVKVLQRKLSYAETEQVSGNMRKAMYREMAGNISASINLMIKAEGSSALKKHKLDCLMAEEIVDRIMGHTEKDRGISLQRRVMAYMVRHSVTRWLYVWIKS